MSATRLLLLDDHTLFRVMLSRLLETDLDFHVVAHCSTTPEALNVLVRHQVDMVLLDYDLGSSAKGASRAAEEKTTTPNSGGPGAPVLREFTGRETGFQFIRQARASGYTGRIFLVTAGMTDADYVAALGQGVCGIFLKLSPPELLIEAIHKVMAGETWIDQRCIQALVQAVAAEGSQTRRNELTERERHVLKGVFAGSSNKEIAASLNISEASVKSALQQLFLKTGVRTRSQLVRVALEEYGSVWALRQ